MKRWWRIVNEADSDSAEILIYDRIGEGWFEDDGVSAKSFSRELKGIPNGKPINVRINSMGGNVFDGLAIYNQLAERRESVTVTVDGIAASIASVIALAGSTLVMPENAQLMIHDPSGMVMGDAREMRKMADILDTAKASLVSVYREKTGLPVARIEAMMSDETWMTGQQAVDQGFADEVSSPMAIAASFDLSCFRRVPEALKGATPPNKKTKNTIMDKTKIIAMLKKQGVKVAADISDEELLGLLEQHTENITASLDAAKDKKVISDLQAFTEKLRKDVDALATPPTPQPDPRLAAIEAQLAAERSRRVTAEFNAIAQDRPSINRDTWLPRALADESVLAALRDFPVEDVGPIRHSLSNCGNPLLEEYSGMRTGSERNSFRLENFGEIQRQRREFLPPQAANTIDSNLLPDWLADALVVVVHNRLAALRGFSRDFGINRMAPLATVQVRKATVGSTAQQDPTNWESGDSTLAAIGVTMHQESVSFHITNAELNSGHRLANLAQINANKLADVISDRWTALVVTGTYGTALTIGAAASFTSAGLSPIYGAAKNFSVKNLILDGGHLGYLLPTDKFQFRLGEAGAFGFDLIAEQNRWTGATANTVGFICEPNAIAVASGLPVDLPSGEFSGNECNQHRGS